MATTLDDHVTGTLGYVDPAVVISDDERDGLWRAPTVPFGSTDRSDTVFEACRISGIDGAHDPPGFVDAGFEAVRLPEVPGLYEHLGEVRDAETLTQERVDRVRSLLTGSTLTLRDGSSLHVDHVADEGVIRRVAGPNRLAVDGDEDHTAARNVHIDQDVQGTPLRQIFGGGAVDAFGHDSPDSRNREASQHLVNLWLPLHQVTRPLALMDGRTLDRSRHQLRYRLPVESFLDRDEDQQTNDIWLLTHEPAHRWWFRPEMGIGDAYVFDTLSTAHGAFEVPGEAVAAERYERIGAVIEAIREDGRAQARELAGSLPDDTTDIATAPLRAAVEAMDAALAEVACAGCEDGDALGEPWIARAEAARDAVVRRSVELRAVVTRRHPG